MRRLILGASVLAGLLALVCLTRALTRTSKQVSVGKVDLIAVDPNEPAKRLGELIRFKTESYEEAGRFDQEAFAQLHAYLAQQYPRAHRELSLEWVNQHTAVYRWEGTQPELAPAILMAHIDVVPVVPGTEDRWEQPAYSGSIADGYIWGRGAIDDKFNIIGILEAVERSLIAGFRPRRTIYLVFGHDEELGGPNGAEPAAELFEKRGIRAAIVLDEGGAIIQGAIPGTTQPVATVGIAEKGSVSLSLSVHGEGGHSSTPLEHTAIGVLGSAVAAVEKHQMPAGLRGASGAMIEYLAPEVSLGYRVLFSNLWLFGPLVETALGTTPAGNATLRTTTAVTMIHGGVKSNVLPTDAQAVVNFRTLPGDTTEVVMDHVRRAVDNPDIQIALVDQAREASEISPSDTDEFRLLSRSIREAFPEAIVTPFLTLGGTDSRHFSRVCPNVFRFSPMLAVKADLARPHGLNERIGVENLGRAVQFYAQFIRNL